MIIVNGAEIKLNHFPDGTLRLDDDGTQEIFGMIAVVNEEVEIEWNFENNEELVAIIFLARHLRERYHVQELYLVMYYIPNARMDRVKSIYDVFTLKYFCEVINSLKFDGVIVADPHSPVSEAMINNIIIHTPNELRAMKNYLDTIKENDCVIYFPDNGAAKKYEDMFKGCQVVYGVKHRDWETGQIQGLEVITNGVDLKGKTVLMWDDIISYGGSMYYGALKLKELGVGKIYAYATHTENSVLDKEKGKLIKLLEDGTVEKLFTTNSLFTGEHEKIEII